MSNSQLLPLSTSQISNLNLPIFVIEFDDIFWCYAKGRYATERNYKNLFTNNL